MNNVVPLAPVRAKREHFDQTHRDSSELHGPMLLLRGLTINSDGTVCADPANCMFHPMQEASTK